MRQYLSTISCFSMLCPSTFLPPLLIATVLRRVMRVLRYPLRPCCVSYNRKKGETHIPSHNLKFDRALFLRPGLPLLRWQVSPNSLLEQSRLLSAAQRAVGQVLYSFRFFFLSSQQLQTAHIWREKIGETGIERGSWWRERRHRGDG